MSVLEPDKIRGRTYIEFGLRVLDGNGPTHAIGEGQRLTSFLSSLAHPSVLELGAVKAPD